MSLLFLAALVTVWVLVPSRLCLPQLEFGDIFTDTFRDRERGSVVSGDKDSLGEDSGTFN